MQATAERLTERGHDGTGDNHQTDDGPRELRRFLVQEHAWLQRVATRLCGRRLDAQDLVQDTIERALRNADRYLPGTNVKAWLRRMMFNLAVDRGRGLRRFRTEPAVDTLAADPPQAPPPWTALGTADVLAVLPQIPEHLGEVFRLFTFDGLSYQDIARRTGSPPATVATRLYRARQRLRVMLEKRLAEAPPFRETAAGRS